MGSLVINHNTSALNAHRNLQLVDKAVKKNLEHLSSGERVVRAADGPATLMISEQMRAQIASVSQAIRNSETSVSMVQTTEASLNEVNRLLLSIRTLAIHAANEGANDENMLNADQFEVINALGAIDRAAQFSQFGSKKLLDGSNGVNGIAAGPGLSFITATEETRQSPAEGYEVKITQAAARATMVAQTPLTPNVVAQGVEMIVQEEGKVARYTTKPGDDPRVVMRQLQNSIDLNGLSLKVGLSPDPDEPEGPGRLTLTHKEYGSEHKFTVVSSVAGVLAEQVSIPQLVANGRDVSGTINSQLASGRGRVLVGASGTEADGLQVHYKGAAPEEPEGPVGRVSVSQNSLIFQIGPNAGQKVSVSLGSVSTRTLGLNVPNESGFQFLADVDLTSARGAEDTLFLVDKAIDDVNVVRASLGAIQKNSLEANIRSLMVAKEELVNSESVLRDADMAQEISELTKNQIMLKSGIAMLSQANQSSRNVLSLIGAQ